MLSKKMEEPTKKAVLVMCGSLYESAKKGRINAKSKEVKKGNKSYTYIGSSCVLV